MPPAWTAAPERCQRRARALAAGTSATWVTGDSVEGADRRLRVWLEAQPPA